MINPLKFVSKIFKSTNQRELDRLQKITENINSLEKEVKKLTDAEFPIKTNNLKEKIKKGENIDKLLPDAFSLVREASRRTRGERHFDVQIIGGIVLHQSKIQFGLCNNTRFSLIGHRRRANSFQRHRPQHVVP